MNMKPKRKPRYNIMTPKFFASVVFLLFSFNYNHLSEAEVSVIPGTVKETRSTDLFSSGLEVQVILAGSDVKAAKSIQVLVTKCEDNSGKNLLDSLVEPPSFKRILDDSNQDNKVTLKLKASNRNAKEIKNLQGEIQIFETGRTDNGVVKISHIRKHIGVPLTHSAFETSGIEITLLDKAGYHSAQQAYDTQNGLLKDKDFPPGFPKFPVSQNPMEPDDLAIQIIDPDHKCGAIEFQNASGTKLPVTSVNNLTQVSYRQSKRVEKLFEFFKSALSLPGTTQLVIYVSTPDATVTTPFKLTDIPLP